VPDLLRWRPAPGCVPEGGEGDGEECMLYVSPC
jgi:hypothetical protein